ncbi:uncharacterized protein LOC134263485 [Saccostrea cucullata]|uniref:uncharacterized protein LOC134263485 n=1 Tax=Saccostrea cuccullata TaxID=36930 RepID=UPI002ED349C6
MKLTNPLLVCHVYVLLLARREILSFEQESLDWFGAQKKCKAQNSSLRTESFKQINAKGTFNFWRGLYTRNSAWIKIVGCYADNVTEAYSPFYKMRGLSTSVGFCQEICMSFNFTIFAIKGNLCRCLEKLPTESALFPLFCNASCSQPGTRNYKPYFNECGGIGTYSVYISGMYK